MDVPFEIKHAFGTETLKCRTCLSVGRKMKPLGELSNIFRKIAPEWLYSDGTSKCLQICWQCTALLRKLSEFRDQVIKAGELLQSTQVFQGSLSNLISVTLNNLQILYIQEENVVNTIAYSDDDFSFNENLTNKPSERGDDVKTKHKSLWSISRAEQNKKPKFKIASQTGNDSTNTHEVFTQIKITNEELVKCLMTVRNCDYYKLNKYKCEFCVLVFSKQKSLDKHNQIYHNEGTFICEICTSKFSSKRHLLAHINGHYYAYKCNVCLFKCCSTEHIYWHIRKCHKKVFICLKCGLQYSSRREFFQHYKLQHEKYICDYCGVTFKMKYCIKNHIRKQHSPIQCAACNRTFARYQGLWLHRKLAHSRPASPAYCVECDKYYPDKYRLQWHLGNSVRHTSRKKLRVPCPECEKVFSKKCTMKQHHTLVHLKQYKYRCDPCDKNFVRNPDLVKHIRKIHEGVQPVRNKLCTICGRGFTTNKILQNHVRTHTGERPFACGDCEARFAQRAALLAHVRTKHANERDGTRDVRYEL